MRIPFNRSYTTGKELAYIQQAIDNDYLEGDGVFTKRCHAWLESNLGCQKALLTSSCTSALEMAAILINIKEGDEVIMPSFTFVSTANAFVLRGAKVVFVDVRPDTHNMDEKLIEQAITPRTKAIVPVHYAGVACEMDSIMAIAKKHVLYVVEDAAQGILSEFRDKKLGTFGHMAALSFHASKNIVCGEGGALLINDASLFERAEIIREKGTNRSRFLRGQVDKYTWLDIGSSFLPSELQAAFLLAQLEHAQDTNNKRLDIWNNYYELLAELEAKGHVKRPIVPVECKQNGHLFYILVNVIDCRDQLISYLKSRDIEAYFHYVPLHTAPAGQSRGRIHGTMGNTNRCGESLIRLPLWIGLKRSDQERIVTSIADFFAQQAPRADFAKVQNVASR